MKRVAREIERSIAELGVKAHKVNADQGHLIRSRVEQRYSAGASAWPLWETSRSQASVQDAQGWRWIEEYVSTNPCYLLFNPKDAVDVFFFDSGEVLTKVLADTFGFEFYVTDEEASFLICFNHHDILSADGNAVEWLSQRRFG